MTVNLELRKKGNNNLARHVGRIPANVYGKGIENQMVFCDRGELEKILSSYSNGLLATAVFDVTINGKKKRAIIKDIQYNRISYVVEHIDFMLVEDTSIVKVKVPVHCFGESKCKGIQQGGILKRVKRYVTTRGPLNKIPKSFSVDIEPLEVGGLVFVKDLSADASLVLMESPKQVLVLVNK